MMLMGSDDTQYFHFVDNVLKIPNIFKFCRQIRKNTPFP